MRATTEREREVCVRRRPFATALNESLLARTNRRNDVSATINPAITPRELLNKVPEVTIYFWIIKIMATTVGETGADFLIFNLRFGLENTSYLMSALLAVVVLSQILVKQYIPWLYWLAVVMVSIVGTLITDNLTDNFAVRLEVTTVVFSLALIATFATWYVSQRTLSIQTIFTTKRESFYWLAILLTFALGTAAGDLASESWRLGYGVAGLIFAGLIAVTVIAHFVFKINSVLTFWLAYILTRPLGASIGDFLSQPRSNGGLGFGTIYTSAVFLLVIVALVGYLTVKQRQLAVEHG
ncbi:hypothetical protein HPT27_12145 [Permianibacter sp. IMCC34836]|nr:hypothetical protein [Permianibacter fluminis]